MNPAPEWAKDIRTLVNRAVAFDKKSPGAGKRMLWDILSALRGPDMDEGYPAPVKFATTARIRGIVCPNTANEVVVDYGSTREADTGAVTNDPTRPFSRSHFRSHLESANYAMKKLGYLPEAKEE